MQSTDDMGLLQEYALRGSEDAFATLVSRHINLVYSVALRHAGNRHSAEEITQAVFIILSRKSRTLCRQTIISGWLFQTTVLTAANFLRSETRRARREQGAYMQSNLHDGGDDTWQQIAPLLNDAIASLDETDRNAILLRFIEGMNLKEVGTALGASEEAAKKRVSRAVEKLRLFFARRGVAFSGAVLTTSIAAKSVEAAPAGLAAAVTAGALKGTVLTASTATLVKGSLKVMAWTKLKFAVAAGVVALIAVQTYEIGSQKKQLALLQEQVAAQNAKANTEPTQSGGLELDQLRTDNKLLSNQLFKIREQLALGKPMETQSIQPQVKLSQDPPRENPGRELGLAGAQGDPTSLEKLASMAKAALQEFRTNGANLNDAERGDLHRRIFAPLREAFDALTDEASRGNQRALLAISHAIQTPELQGFAITAAGVLAGNGDEGALEILLNPKTYGVLPTTTIGALKPAADHGNQKAIDALAAVAADQSKKALWYLAADGLGNAAASGNVSAIDALIAMSRGTNESVQRVVIAGLQRASANQNTQATDALRQMKTP